MFTLKEKVVYDTQHEYYTTTYEYVLKDNSLQKILDKFSCNEARWFGNTILYNGITFDSLCGGIVNLHMTGELGEEYTEKEIKIIKEVYNSNLNERKAIYKLGTDLIIASEKNIKNVLGDTE